MISLHEFTSFTEEELSYMYKFSRYVSFVDVINLTFSVYIYEDYQALEICRFREDPLTNMLCT